METLVSIAAVLVSGAVGIGLWLLQQIIRDCLQGKPVTMSRERLVWISALCCYVFLLVAFGLVSAGIFKIVEDCGLRTGIPSLALPAPILYGV